MVSAFPKATMASTKIQRALHGPSVFEVLFGAVLSVVLGAAIAAVYLLFKPVETVRALPKEPDPTMVYFVEGNRDVMKARAWVRKRQQLAESVPGEVVFTEEELNAWAGEIGKPDPKDVAAGGAQQPQVGNDFVMFKPKALNFRIADGALQAAVPGTVEFSGIPIPFVAQARGKFALRDGAWLFVPEELHLGSLAVHRFPWLMEKIVARYSEPGGPVHQAHQFLRRVTVIKIDGRTLRLTMP
jgi:hypothetical protein